MERRWQTLVAVALALVLPVVTVGFNIRNERTGRCLTALKHKGRHRLELADCQPDSDGQQWHWDPESCSIKSLEADECLSAAGTYPKHDGVRLRSCHVDDGDGDDDDDYGGRSRGDTQAWTCSKKGHITLQGNRLYLSVRHNQELPVPTKTKLLHLSKERGQESQWRTLSNSTVCGEGGGGDGGRGMCLRRPPHNIELHPTTTPSMLPLSLSDMQAGEGMDSPDPTGQSTNTSLPVQPLMPGQGLADFFAMDFGLPWKVTMLVLSSLALVLGFVILILSILQNRKKSVVVLKSYTRTGEESQPGSPVLHDRAPLTKNPMRTPAQTPTLIRGEILVAWKDGTVTPLFDGTYQAE
ncbi:uncharacterized protein si:dkey-245n4.2 isoform X2 [Engraulis encrasicolus]|uniref:uncharacterized protein si:dkey-245n4.2 isoform X2 n=1 Tax=Engraulis encrasicolus TaxID=184585 RepID=UPI002FCF403B